MEVVLDSKIVEQLKKAVGEENVFLNEPMSKHTSFKTGGHADYFVVPHNAKEISDICTIAKENNLDTYILGNGSNTLVTDKGIRGVVVSLRGFNNIQVDNDTITVGAGVSIGAVSRIAQENGLSGLEFACGIPGTIGGGIYMNAGAYGGEFKDVITSVKYFDYASLETKSLTNEECKFDYRKSVFQSMKDAFIITCSLSLKPGDKEEIKRVMEENMTSRNTKQPVEFPSAGSTFKREEGVIVSKLIDEAGLKGYKIGGAEVSTKHANFVINRDNATSDDVYELVNLIHDTVLEKTNVDLEIEQEFVDWD